MESKEELTELLFEKKKLLIRLERFKKLGFSPTKKYTTEDALIDIKAEVEAITMEINLQENIKTAKKLFVILSYFIEKTLNVKNLSKDIEFDLDDGVYNDLFEQLFDKYRNVELSPEIKLVSLFGSSLAKCYTTQKFIKEAKVDNICPDDILKKFENDNISSDDILKELENNINILCKQKNN